MPQQSNIERLPKSRIVSAVTFTNDERKKAEEDALRHLSEQVNIKGFRVGHAPADMVRSRFSEEKILEETVRHLMRSLLPALVQEHALHPVILPKIEITTKEPLGVRITFIEKPKVTIKNIDTLKIEKKETKIDPAEVQKVIDSILADYRTGKEVDRAAQTDDRVTIDFTANDKEGKPIEGMVASGYQALIGAKTLLPGFEDELIGLKKGDTKTFVITLPAKFQVEALRGKPATFQVTVKNIEETTLPMLDDAFAKEKLGSVSVDAFRSMVEQSMKAQEEQFHRMHRERELMDEIRKRTDAEIAEELIDEELRELVQEWSEHIQKQGVTMEEALKKEGKTVQQVEADLKKQAEERWKLRLGMAHLIEHKGITITDDEVERASVGFISGLPDDQKPRATEEFGKRGRLYEEIRWRALVEKVVDGLLAA